MIDLKAFAGQKYRVTLDESADLDGSREERLWCYRIPCKYGFIGVHGPPKLMAFCKATRLFTALLALPGVESRQRGDKELNVTFPVESLDVVADCLHARRRRRVSDAEKARLVAMSAEHRFKPAVSTSVRAR